MTTETHTIKDAKVTFGRDRLDINQLIKAATKGAGNRKERRRKQAGLKKLIRGKS